MPRPRLPADVETIVSKVSPPGRRCSSPRRCPGDRRPGSPVHVPADPHPRHGRGRRRLAHRRGDRALRLPRARHGQDRAARPSAPSPGPWPHHHLRPDQAHRSQVADDLTERGFAAASLHGDLGQGAREQSPAGLPQGQGRRPRRHRCRGARYRRRARHPCHQLPVPRGTRRPTSTAPGAPVGRATPASPSPSSTGTTCPLGLVDKALDLGIPEPVETYSSSDHLFSDLDIPGTTGRLPNAARTREGLDAEEVGTSARPVDARAAAATVTVVAAATRTGASVAAASAAARAATVGRAPGRATRGAAPARPARARVRHQPALVAPADSGCQSGAGATQQAGLGSTAHGRVGR